MATRDIEAANRIAEQLEAVASALGEMGAFSDAGGDTVFTPESLECFALAGARISDAMRDGASEIAGAIYDLAAAIRETR